jgi:hypothetical protein
MTETYLLVMRCPVHRRRDSSPGYRTELENLSSDEEGKRPKWKNCEAESTDALVRGGLSCKSEEAA